MDADDFCRFTEVLGVTKMSMLAHVEICLGEEEVPILSDILPRLSEIAILKTLRLDSEEDDFEAFKEKLIRICDIFAFAEKVDVEVCNITTIKGETDAFGTTEFVDEICTWGCKVGETEWWSDYDQMNWSETLPYF
ncbi:MAG: hypothetical protein Q9202_005920 [Teloschistes flavicans]